MRVNRAWSLFVADFCVIRPALPCVQCPSRGLSAAVGPRSILIPLSHTMLPITIEATLIVVLRTAVAML